MNNETFGMTLQYAICEHFSLVHDIASHRIDSRLKDAVLNSGVIDKIFKDLPKPIEFLTTSKKFTSEFIRRCPHNFLLENEETFSMKSFSGSNSMFAPKVVGQGGDRVMNHYYGDIYHEPISIYNFKRFCLEKINEILPIVVDFALISDYNCLVVRSDDKFEFELFKRDVWPDLTYSREDFTSTKKSVGDWTESNTFKYKGRSVLEIQQHRHRTPPYKLRLNRKNFIELLKSEKKINNSMLGDTAELAICELFELDAEKDNYRLKNNSEPRLLNDFKEHYATEQERLFPYKPTRYGGTESRARKGHSKSGVDFYLEKDLTLSVKTNKSGGYKVCPPEIGQPSPKTFDRYFADRGWYEGEMNEEKFRLLVRNPKIVAELLAEYVEYLNECDYILWSIYSEKKGIESQLLNKGDLDKFEFDPSKIGYTNDFTTSGSVTVKYGEESSSIGEFQIHSARNSLKFRFHMNNLLSLK